jgi:hypothetical protein
MTRKRTRPPKNISEVLLSGRTAKRLEALYVLIVKDQDGTEGIVCRNTIVGTMPFITDDVTLMARMMELAKSTPYAEDELGVAVFARVQDIRTINRTLPTEPIPDPGPAPDPDSPEALKARLERGLGHQAPTLPEGAP